MNKVLDTATIMDKVKRDHLRVVSIMNKLANIVKHNFSVCLPEKNCRYWMRITWPAIYTGLALTVIVILSTTASTDIHVITQQMLIGEGSIQISGNFWNRIFFDNNICRLMKWLDETYSDPGEERLRAIVVHRLTEANHKCWIFARIIVMAIVVVTLLFVAAPILMNTLPIPIEWNGTTTLPLPVMALIYCLELIFAMVTMSGQSVYNIFAVTYIVTLYYRFKVLSDLLRTLCYDGPRDDELDLAVLKLAYVNHLDLLRSAKEFQIYFRHFGLIQLSSDVLMCSSSLYIMQIIGIDGYSLSLMVYCVGQMFIVCLGGQLLTTEADLIAMHLYKVPWYRMSLTNKRVFLNMMTGSQIEVVLKAGGLYYFTLESFAKFLKAGVSLCAFLKATSHNV